MIIQPDILARFQSRMYEATTAELWKFIDALHHTANSESNRKKVFEVELVERRAPRYYERVPYGRRYARHDEYDNEEKECKNQQGATERLSLYLRLVPGGTAEQGLTAL